jgi:hypothetical protein
MVLLGAVARPVRADGRGAQFEVEGVHHELTDGLFDVDVDLDATGEGEVLEVGGDEDPVGRGDHRSGETIGVCWGVHWSQA